MNIYRRNIYKLFLIQALKWFMLIMPIVVFFYQNVGLSMQDIFLVQAAFAVTVLVCEIPSGYLADVLGRKLSIVLGMAIGALGFVFYSFATGFWEFVFVEVLLGIGGACISGADSALLYDSLLEMNEEIHYKRDEGRFVFIAGASEALAGLIGGALATINIRYPFYAETLVLASAVPVAITLVEPERSKMDRSDGNWKAILRVVRFALIETPKLRYVILLAAVMGSASLSAAWFVQAYLSYVNTPLSWYGPVWAVLNLSVGCFSLIAYRIEENLGRRRTAMLLVFLVSLTYALLGLAQGFAGVAIFLIIYFCRGLANPVFKDYINSLTSSDIRATVLSVRAFAVRIAFVCVGPFLGTLADWYTLPVAFLAGSVIFALLGGLAVFAMIRSN